MPPTMSDSDNRRRFDRYSADDVQGSFSYAVEALVLNISLGGFAVRTGTQLTIGRIYRFRLGSGPEAVNLSGTVRWCRMAGTEKRESGDIVPVYEAGIAFDEVLTEQAGELRRFMEKSIVVDVKRRIFGRFRASQKEPVTLESKSKFLVKQISMSGVLVETEMALDAEEIFDLELRLDRTKFASTVRAAHVAKIESEDGKSRYQMGLEFIDIDQNQRDLLEKFIRGQVAREKLENDDKESE